jgi:endonuclease YncB( thermonuclease family)
LLSALVVLTSSNAAWAGDILAGPARVVDGDTLYVQGKKIRLYGLDAPEKAQLCRDSRDSDYNCGQRSLQELTKLLEGQFVACDVKTIDMYGRSVASCSVQRGKQVQDVGAWLVSNGYAVAYR